MKHARSDYDRIQDPSGLIPEDEPVFLLRAQDVVAPKILDTYAALVEMRGGDPEVVRLTREHAERMREWQREHGYKMPDLPKVEVV